MSNKSNDSKPWILYDKATGLEKQRKVGAHLMMERNPDLRLHGFGAKRPAGYENVRKEFGEELFYCSFFVEYCLERARKNPVLVSSNYLTAVANDWMRKHDRSIKIHPGSVIATIIMEGFAYERLADGSVLVALEEK